MTVTTPAPPPISDELERLCRRLRLPYLRKAAPGVIATATSQRWDPTEVLRVLLAEEETGRDRATIQMRRRSSGLPAGKTFDAWDPAVSAIPTQTQQALRTLEWIGRAENLAICGPSGSGKACAAIGRDPAEIRRSVQVPAGEDPAEITRRVRGFAEAGFSEIIIMLSGGGMPTAADPVRTAAMLGEKVLPALRG